MFRGKPCPAEFKAKVALEALQGARTVNEIATAYELAISELLPRI